MVIASNLFAVVKIIKVLGGFKEPAKLIVRAKTWEGKIGADGSAFKILASEISEVDELYVCTKFFK